MSPEGTLSSDVLLQQLLRRSLSRENHGLLVRVNNPPTRDKRQHSQDWLVRKRRQLGRPIAFVTPMGLIHGPEIGIVCPGERKVPVKVDRWRRTYGPVMVVLLVFSGLLFRLLQIVHRYSVNIFFTDHWSIEDSTLFGNHSWLEIFRWQYGLHREGLGGLLLAIFEPLTGWNERATAYLAVGILAGACGGALMVKRRLFGSITWLDVTIPLLFLTPTQYETFLGSLNPAYAPLPTLLVVLFCLSWTLKDERLRRPILLAINLCSIYTGYGIFLGLLAPVLFAMETICTRTLKAWISLLVSVLSLASFFIGYQALGGEVCHGIASNVGDYATFVVVLLSRFAQIPRSLPAAALCSALVAICILGAAVLDFTAKLNIGSSVSVVAYTLLAFSALFVATAAYGRSCFAAGVESRYMSYLTLAFFGLYLGSLRATAKTRGLVILPLVAALLSSASVRPDLQQSINRLSTLQLAWRDCYISTHNITACDARAGSFIYNQPEPSDLQTKLDFLESHRLSLFH